MRLGVDLKFPGHESRCAIIVAIFSGAFRETVLRIVQLHSRAIVHPCAIYPCAIYAAIFYCGNFFRRLPEKLGKLCFAACSFMPEQASSSLRNLLHSGESFTLAT